jgi:hypothetical protein
VDDQHVLRLERLLLPGAVVPLADERLLASSDVLAVDVLKPNKVVAELCVAPEKVFGERS